MNGNYGDLKYIYKDMLGGLKSPEKTGGALIILMIYKRLFSENFSNITVKILENFGFIINVLEAFLICTFIACGISVISTFIYGSIYFFMDEIYFKKTNRIFSDRKIEILEKLEKFFIGSQAFAVKSGMWILIFEGYIYLLDSNIAMMYINILNIEDSKGILRSVIIVFIIFFLLIASINMIRNILYEFFYYKSITKDMNNN